MKHVISVPWTDEERTLLRQLWENGMGPVLIGRLLGRSKYSVTKQTQALKLPRHRLPPGLARPTLEPRQGPAQPLRPGARTLPPLPSELTAENSSHG
jgi:hypothetical protein